MKASATNDLKMRILMMNPPWVIGVVSLIPLPRGTVQ
jgi:hypothetical protein